MNNTYIEIYTIIATLCYGIFLGTSYDIVKFICMKYQKGWKITIEILFSIVIIYITYRFAHQLNCGDISLYAVLFLVIGLFLYNIFFQKSLMKGLFMLGYFAYKVNKPIKKIFSFLVIPHQTFEVFKSLFVAFLKAIKGLFVKNKKRK